MMSNKILIFSTTYFPYFGGAEVAIKEITNRLSGDFEFDMITVRARKDLPRVEKIGAVTIYRVGIGNLAFDKFFLPFLGAMKIAELEKTRNYFCFWAMMVSQASGAGYVYNFFRKLTGKKKIPIVLTLQEGDSESHLNYRWAGLIDLSWRYALRRTDTLIALSDFLLKRAEKKGYKGRSVLVPNGVDISVFTKEINEETKTDMKNRLAKKDGDVFLVTSSRLVHKNAVDDIISALVNLPKNVSLIVMGKGELGFRLQRQARNMGVADRVKFLGLVANADLPKYFSVCDIFIRPSRSEGFGSSFIEAMAAGLPVIATPVGGIPDFLDDRETGIFCSPDNPQSIVEAVTLLLSDGGLKEKIIRQARERVIRDYNWEDIARKMKVEVFEKIAEI